MVAGVVGGVLVVATALAWPQVQRFTTGLPPDQFNRALDPALLKDYSGVRGIAHNAGNRLDTLAVALDHGADVIEVDLISVRGELVGGRDQPLPWLSNHLFRGPPLEDVWDAAATAPVLKLDLKQSDPRFIDDVIAFLQPRQGSREVMISTRDREALLRLHSALPHVTLLFSIGFPEGLAQLRRDTDLQSAVGGVSIFHGLVDDSTMDWLHSQGLLVLAWPVDDVERLNRLVRLGVDGVTTANLAILEVLSS